MFRRGLFGIFLLWGALAVDKNSAEVFRLVGGRCRGQLQVQRPGQDWTDVSPKGTLVPLWFGHRVCLELGCGSILTVERTTVPSREAVNFNPYTCEKTSLSSCFYSGRFRSDLSVELSCSESVKLESGPSSCSGSLQIRESLNQSWTQVCDGALGRGGAEVLCRELSCGAPVLQGELSPLGQMFHCEGNETALMDCPRTKTRSRTRTRTPTPTPETCPPLQLTCSEPVRLTGGASRCEGEVEVEIRGEWRRVRPRTDWSLEHGAAVCRDLDCGSALSTEVRGGFEDRPVWTVTSNCVKESSVRDCVYDGSTADVGVWLLCSELLFRPVVSVSEAAPRSEGGVWVQVGEDFRVTCSVKPQYKGGSFQLFSPTDNRTAIAVNHSAYFLFTKTSSAHRGSYTCVYLLQVFNHNFSSNASVLVYPRDGSNMWLLVLIPVFLVIVISATVLTICCRRRRATAAGADPNAQREYENLCLDQMDPANDVLTRNLLGSV